ncbi:MAG: hypothetical protein ABIG84_03450 [archaeon]
MHCINHPKIKSTGACVECGKLFCDQCILLVGRKRYCKECAAEILKEGDESNSLTLNKVKHNGIVITQQTTNIQTPSSHTEDIETHMSKETMEKIFKYFVSIFYAILTFTYLEQGTPIFLFLLLVSLIWLPPFESWINEKLKITIPLWLKIIFIILSFILIGISG